MVKPFDLSNALTNFAILFQLYCQQMQYPKIQEILRDSKFSLNVFNHSEIQPLEEKLTSAKDKKGNSYYVAECPRQGNAIKMTPKIRQLF